jgi:hypothetical protein
MAPNSTLYPFLELEAGSVPPSFNFPQLDFVRPSNGFHPVTWERVNNVSLNLISIRGLHPKLSGPKVAKVPTLGISGLLFGSPGIKCHLDVGLVKRHRIYYKGEGGGFPQVWDMLSFVSMSLLVVCPNTKSAQIMH